MCVCTYIVSSASSSLHLLPTVGQRRVTFTVTIITITIKLNQCRHVPVSMCCCAVVLNVELLCASAAHFSSCFDQPSWVVPVCLLSVVVYIVCSTILRQLSLLCCTQCLRVCTVVGLYVSTQLYSKENIPCMQRAKCVECYTACEVRGTIASKALHAQATMGYRTTAYVRCTLYADVM
jgi:hypothetical protein